MYSSHRRSFLGLSSLSIRYLVEAQARCGVCLESGEDPPTSWLPGDRIQFNHLTLVLTVWFNGTYVYRLGRNSSRTPLLLHIAHISGYVLRTVKGTTVLAASLVRRVLP